MIGFDEDTPCAKHMMKAILFDVDGVLIDSFEANVKFYQDLMKLAGYAEPTKDMIRERYHMTMEQVIRSLIPEKDEDEVKRIWTMGKNRDIPYPDELLTTPQNYDVIIKKLSEMYILGIVTSRVKIGVFCLKQLKDLEQYFKTAVYFEDTVKHKPEPEPLLLACERLGVRPEETVYVGDTASDIQAAKSAGLKVVLYSKQNISGADMITDSFEQILTLVESL